MLLAPMRSLLILVLPSLAHMLDRIIAHNDALPSDRPLTRFHSKAAPAISPHAYLTRITTFTNVDPCIIIILLYYIDRLSEYLTISSLTIHRFLISAICCGSKALSDSFATNSRYARVGGVDLVEMNALEREFLLAINWRLAVCHRCNVDGPFSEVFPFHRLQAQCSNNTG